ncbi:MAG TPA: alpha/beta fold hydrolase [Hydrogenophaga sp.]
MMKPLGWLGALRTLAGVALTGALLATAGCASFDEWGRAKVYRPTAIDSPQAWQSMLATRPDVGTLEVPVGKAGERVTVLRVPATAAIAGAGEIRVLYLHGTFRHAFRNLPKTAPMAAAGMTVFVPDYRGWGVSSPLLPSERSILEDARAVWQALHRYSAEAEREQPVRWVIYGHSMGSAVAVALAAQLKAERAYCALVLESSFTSFSDVAYAAAGWVGRWLVAMGDQRMDAGSVIADVRPPVWFLHGEEDKTVPLYLGRRLFDQAPAPKHWSQWPLAHSDLHTDPSGRYEQVWRDIAASCEKAPA